MMPLSYHLSNLALLALKTMRLLVQKFYYQLLIHNFEQVIISFNYFFQNHLKTMVVQM